MSAISNSNYCEMAWVQPDVECLQMPNEIYTNYADGLDNPSYGVEYN